MWVGRMRAVDIEIMKRLGDIDRVTSAAQWMQPTAETDNDSEDQCKDYAYDETDYGDSDSDLEEGEIREEEPDEQDLINLQEDSNTLQEDEHSMQIQLRHSEEERTCRQSSTSFKFVNGA